MVTAPAPALPDSHALPQAAVGAASNSSQSPNSFQSVYQSLPAHPGGSENSISKAPGAKKASSKGTDDNLAAIVSTATVDSSPARPLAPSLPSFSLTAGDHGAATEPGANEVAQLSPGVQSSVQFGVNSFQSQVAPAATESASQSIARREALNSQPSVSAPSFSLAAPALPAIPEVSLPDPKQPANAARSPRTAAATSSEPAIDPAIFSKGLASALAPRQSNLAFSLKMAESSSTARRAQQATQGEPADRNTSATQTKGQERTPSLTLPTSAAHTSEAPATATGEAAAVAATVNPAWNAAAASPQLDISSSTQFSEPREPVNPSTVAAVHEAQNILPDTQRPAAAAEIMLQLGGKDQAAAIRVTDRAGTVSVSVHAADADLRTSLRSNLGDLATQLSHQGWKTEVVKTGTVLTRAETSQDPQQGGQRSPNQQQPSAQGDRQPQKDRRSNSGQWLAEFEEQASGNSGGTN
jgi:hypothetical protein